MAGYVLIPLRSDRTVSSGSMLNLVVTLALMLSLVSRFGLFGVAAARVIAEAVVTVFLATALQRKQLWRRIWADAPAADGGGVSAAPAGVMTAPLAGEVMSSERD
jgi:O-antigen/teichoic acid export membrane protein